MSIVADCANCIHSRFCESWGEYKCLKHQHRIYIQSLQEQGIECPDFKRAAKSIDKKPCQCGTCTGRAEYDE